MTSIFMSHNWADKNFARRLAKDLSDNGIKVWIDEAELLVGDSLIKKITEAIESVDYVGAIISSNSVNSKWVRKELEIALTQEISGKQLRVIPILLENVELPLFLKDRIYADFTNNEKYNEGLNQLLKRFYVNISEENIRGKKLIIYSEKLSLGWEDWSWDSKCNFNSTDYKVSAKYSICVELKGYGGFSIAYPKGLSTKWYNKLRFSMNGGKKGGQRLKLFLSDRTDNGIKNPVILGNLEPNKWKLENFTLEDLDAKDIIIYRISISNIDIRKQPKFYIDNIELTS